jgi:hypothetical protein
MNDTPLSEVYMAFLEMIYFCLWVTGCHYTDIVYIFLL